MKSAPTDERMLQMAERDMQEVFKGIVKRDIERLKQQREQKKRDSESSNAEIIRQPVESPA